MTVTRPELRDVTRWSRRARKALAQRDEAIRLAVAAGCSLRAVGEAADMTHRGVSRVCQRAEEEGRRRW